MPRRRPLVASSFPTPPRRSRSRARSSPLDPAAATRAASSSPSTSESATASYSANGRAPAGIGRAAAALFARRREPMADLISDSQEHDGVLRNLSSLSPEDQEAFVELLKSVAPRFVVHRLCTAYPLLSKGILRSVQILDDLDWICEFHPAITNRAKLLALAEADRDGESA